jgi:signal transduction histidine kinase
MDDSLGCPHCGASSPALKAISDAVLAIAAELSVERALHKIVDVARDLVQAEYAALGVPDGRGGFAQFITSGMTSEQWDAIGPLPRTHGLLGAMLENTAPFRTPDVQLDPRFAGWPEAHPDMHSFLGVPIVSRGEIIAAFYLTDKHGAPQFTESDQRLIEVLAAHAAIAIENARLYERSRELSVIEERNRLARELHDAVSQTLFSAVLTAEAAAALIERDPAKAKAQLDKLQELAQHARDEMRSLIFELRPADLESDGLIPTLRKHVVVLQRLYETEITLQIEGERRLRPQTEREIFRITQEALNNALKHARAKKIDVALRLTRNRAAVTVSDDGVGFELEVERTLSRRLGLVSMRERADAIRGLLEVQSAPGAGTRVSLEVAHGR